jgi:hypothetical protein
MAELSRVPSLDMAFLQRWSPARVMAFSILFYGAAVLISPLQYPFELITSAAVVYAVVAMLAFFMGCYIGQTINFRRGAIAPLPFQVPLDRYINIVICFTALSIAARVYDRFFLRGFNVEETFWQTRESAEANVSLFGYLGGPGFCLGVIALMLIWLSASQRRRPVTFVIACILAAYPMIEALLQGSRSTMLYTAFMVFFSARATGALAWLVRSRFAMILAALMLLGLFQIIFEIRSLEGGGYEESISEVYRLSALSEFASAPIWLTNMIIETDGGGVIAGILKTWVHFEQYVTHSWLVYFANFDNFQDGVHGWGRYHLNMPLRFLGVMLDADLSYNPFDNGMSEGLFSTAFSYMYYDFGPLGPFLAGVFGLMATLLQRMTIRLPERWLPLYTLVCFATAMTLIDNLLIGGVGAFAIWGTLLYVLIHIIVSTVSRQSFSSASEALSVDHPTAADTAD